MEGERGVPNYDLQVSFTNTPQAIHEMSFVQFEENQVLGFLSPSSQSQSSQLSQSLNGGSAGSTAATTAPPTAATTATTTGFSHNELVTTRTWHNEQVVHF